MRQRADRGWKGGRDAGDEIDGEEKTGGCKGGVSTQTLDKGSMLMMSSGCHNVPPLSVLGGASSWPSSRTTLPVSRSVPRREEACVSQGYALTYAKATDGGMHKQSSNAPQKQILSTVAES